MGLPGRPTSRCEACGRKHSTTRYDRTRRRHLCLGCWQVLGPPPGTPPHPEDRPDWRPGAGGRRP